MSQPFKLFRLQQIDSQLARANTRLHEIEIALNDNYAFRKAKDFADEKASTLEKARKSLHRAEENVQSQQIKIEQSEATLYSGKVSNPKELQDLQNEVAALKRYLSVLEDRQLEAMISVEEAEGEYKAASLALERARRENTQQQVRLTEEQGELLQEVERLENERQAALDSIPIDDVLMYNELRQKKRGVAVARVIDKTCSACGSTLTASMLQASRSPNKISLCDTCGRILYGG